MFSPNHNAVSVVWWRDSLRRVWILVVDSTTTNPLYPQKTQVKLPGGGHYTEETPQQTAERELEEETGLIVKRRSRLRFIYEHLVRGHLKTAYIISRYACRGKLRTEDLVEGDSILGPPRAILLDDAIGDDEGKGEVLWSKENPFNRDALIEARKWINKYHPAA